MPCCVLGFLVYVPFHAYRLIHIALWDCVPTSRNLCAYLTAVNVTAPCSSLCCMYITLSCIPACMYVSVYPSLPMSGCVCMCACVHVCLFLAASSQPSLSLTHVSGGSVAPVYSSLHISLHSTVVVSPPPPGGAMAMPQQDTIKTTGREPRIIVTQCRVCCVAQCTIILHFYCVSPALQSLA